MGFLNNQTHTPLLIAEIGGNHEGNFKYAKELTRLAIESDADAVKFQIYTGDTLVSQIESPTRNSHFKKFELTPEQHIKLAKMVIDAGKMYSASVWDINALEWINPFISFYKIGSGDLTAYPVIKATVEMQKPLIISTGLSTEKEVEDCVNYIQGINPIYKKTENLAVLQCTSMYPIPEHDAHLNVMKHFKYKYGWSTGYSDHTEGSYAREVAASMGAEVLEFHFTDSRENKSFRDHKVSLTVDEVNILKKKINIIKNLQGSTEKKPLSVETENNHEISFRRSVYPLSDISKGERLDETNLTVLRPLSGIDAKDFYKVIGRKLLVDVKKHQKLEWTMLSD